MLYNTDKGVKLWAHRLQWIKKLIITIVLGSMLVTLSACTLLTKPLDNRTGFSGHVGQLESDIRNEDWQQAKLSLEHSKKAWKKLKPFIQVDVDHDYVKDMEDGFIKLDGYLETKDKSNALVSILLIAGTWKDIGSL